MKKYASFGNRLSAHLGDIIIVNLVGMSIVILKIGIEELFNLATVKILNYETLILIIWCLYSSIFNSSNFKGTLGKRKLGLIIVDVNGRKLSIAKSFVRFVIGFLLFGIIIGMIPILFTRKKQGIHDILLSTVVIRKR